ncbi:MAG TPA: alpha-L-fucosidase, partial [Thermoguttaceae bacterium]|nr:alpha-L-fucosidase [Thermoguttaceae bacterium]
MTHRLASALLLLSLLLVPAATAPAAETPKEKPAASKVAPPDVDAWRKLKFGLFIHWGPVSLKGTEIGWSRAGQRRGMGWNMPGDKVPADVYDNLYKQFNPTKFDADEWVQIAKDSGMKYMVFTTKHRDGFCMFDTKQTDFSIMSSPFHRDVVKELAAACKKHGLAFGTYHSVVDWHHPDHPNGSPGGSTLKPNANIDRYETYLKNQVAELIRNYG